MRRVWMHNLNHERSAKEVLARAGLSAQHSHASLARCLSWQTRSFYRDLRQSPRLVPLFPVGSFTPGSVCGHYGPIERGSVFCCMICHNSGQDDHPSLQNNSSFKDRYKAKSCDWIPSAHSWETVPSETRKQRRQRVFRGIAHATKQ
jgi:hypothetical protein